MMEKINDFKDKLIELILAQKLLTALSVVIVVMLISIVYLSTASVSVKKTSTLLTGSPNQEPNPQQTPLLQAGVTSFPNVSPVTSPINEAKDSSINLFTKIFQFFISNKPSVTTAPQVPFVSLQPRNTSSPNQPTLSNQTSQPATVQISSGQSGSVVLQPTAIVNPTNTVPNTNPTSTPESTAPQIVFIGSDGQAQTYTPPSTPPVEIIWARYTNDLEHYAIDYPSNWQIVKTTYRGHDAIFIYSPGADPSDPNVQYISYGWSSYFYPPTANYVGSFIQDGVQGTIYTNGVIGSSYIAGVFQYFNGFLVLNNNISDATFAYIFNQMITSLDFNTP